MTRAEFLIALAGFQTQIDEIASSVERLQKDVNEMAARLAVVEARINGAPHVRPV